MSSLLPGSRPVPHRDNASAGAAALSGHCRHRPVQALGLLLAGACLALPLAGCATHASPAARTSPGSQAGPVSEASRTSPPAPASADGGDPTVPANDYQMAEAIREARRTLPDFLGVAAAPPANTVGFRLRVSVNDGTRREFVWVMPYRQLGDNDFVGTVAEQPAYLTNVSRGQELRFDRSAIVDWGYTANGHDIGSRTVCVMLQRMPKERADALRREHRMSC